jgi:hypothetical protein
LECHLDGVEAGGLPRVPDALVQQCRRQPRTPPSGGAVLRRRRQVGGEARPSDGRRVGVRHAVRGQGANHRVQLIGPGHLADYFPLLLICCGASLLLGLEGVRAVVAHTGARSARSRSHA